MDNNQENRAQIPTQKEEKEEKNFSNALVETKKQTVWIGEFIGEQFDSRT